jgi:hypothetical protein
MTRPFRLGRLEVRVAARSVYTNKQWAEFFTLVEYVLGGDGVYHLDPMAIQYGHEEGGAKWLLPDYPSLRMRGIDEQVGGALTELLVDEHGAHDTAQGLGWGVAPHRITARSQIPGFGTVHGVMQVNRSGFLETY